VKYLTFSFIQTLFVVCDQLIGFSKEEAHNMAGTTTEINKLEGSGDKHW
jgi:hypothetical protein